MRNLIDLTGLYGRGIVAAIVLLLVTVVVAGSLGGRAMAQTNPPEFRENPTGGQVPGQTLGGTSDAEFWRAIRGGERGIVTDSDNMAGQLIQSGGETWLSIRNGPLSTWGSWALIGIVIVLALFFLLRGRIRIEQGWAGRTIIRFGFIERMGHWLLAGSFIVLAITGLNVLYGRYVLLPVLGPDLFSTLTQWGKFAHNYISFAFMTGLVLVFVMWVANNLPNRYDVIWLLKAGGMLSRHSHPPAKKFNAGQKILFWLVILGGLSISLSGIALLFPFHTHFFLDTFEILNRWGASLPTQLTLLEEMQLAQLWHSIAAVFLTVIIIGHIYIGTLGMEGAFDAMGSGEVDVNWAKEHHSVWLEEVEAGNAKPVSTAAAEPAE